jgi:molecular chaperone DnaK
MRITPTSGLTPDEIDRLIRESEEFADSDRATKELLVLRTKLDSLLRNTKKSFTKFGGLLPEIEQESAETVFTEAEAASRTEKLEELKIAMSKLERVAGQLTSAMLDPTDATTEV